MFVKYFRVPYLRHYWPLSFSNPPNVDKTTKKAIFIPFLNDNPKVKNNFRIETTVINGACTVSSMYIKNFVYLITYLLGF